MKLHSAVLYTNDISKVADFYANKIGLDLDYIEEGTYVSFKFDNGTNLAIKK